VLDAGLDHGINVIDTATTYAGVEPVRVGGRQPVDADRAERWEDVRLDCGAVADQGRRCSSLGLDVGHPSVQQFGDRSAPAFTMRAVLDLADELGGSPCAARCRCGGARRKSL
jgi:hypothetical protein